MKYIITVLAMVFINLTAFAQKTPTLKANETISKAETISAQQPKISLNEHKCRLGHITIKNDINGTYGLEVVFERPCDDENSVTVSFRDLNEALLVKDLILNKHGYDFFNLFTEKDGPSSFEIVYSH